MRTVTVITCACLLAGTACSKTEHKELAPAASALSSAKPVTEMAKSFRIDTSESGIQFTMDAELEQISGRAPKSVTGDVHVDLMDLGKSSGLVKVDLDQLSIYKKVREDADGEFGEEEKNEKQNKDMRNWFQIGEDAPDGDRERYRWVEFKIDAVKATPNDVTQLSGATRSVKATVSGDFRLHGRVSKKSIQVELVFGFEGDQPKSLSIKTTEPFDVGLEEHDIKPRKSFAQLADATLEALGHKVSKVAKVSIDAHAKLK